MPSSVSKRYSLSIGTQGSSWRRRASSSLRRVSSFSALSSFSPATSQSSRVPVLWSSSFLSFLGRADPPLTQDHDCFVLRGWPPLAFIELDVSRTSKSTTSWRNSVY